MSIPPGEDQSRFTVQVAGIYTITAMIYAEPFGLLTVNLYTDRDGHKNPATLKYNIPPDSPPELKATGLPLVAGNQVWINVACDRDGARVVTSTVNGERTHISFSVV